MTEISIQKLDRKQIEKAQFLYYSNKEITEIASVLNIDPETIRFYVYGPDGDGKIATCWSAIKKRMKPTVFSLFINSKIDVLEGTAGLGMEIINHALNYTRNELISGERDPLTIDEIAKLSKVVVDLDKLYRLEAGLATEQIEHMGLTRAEAKEILANDPFANAVEVESVELPWLVENE